MKLQATLQTLLEKSSLKNNSPLYFRVNQIFHGKVIKLFPGSFAEIQLGSQKMLAKLEVPLVNGEGYWFQVTSNDSEIRLRLLPTNNYDNSALMQHVNISNTKSNKALIQFLRENNIPLAKNEITQISHLLTLTSDFERGLQTIQMMHTNNLPFHERIFHSLLATSSNIAFTDLLTSLQASLLSESSETETSKQLLTFLEVMNTNDVSTANSRSELMHILKQTQNRTGIFYEGNIFHKEIHPKLDQQSLKSLLVQLVQDNSISPNIREIADQITLRMNGMQLLSNDTGHFQQLLYEIPLNIGGHKTDLTMQWSGKKTNDGKISADFCRIIFYLELQHIKSTIVDMQVQNRVVTVNIFNENPKLSLLAQTFIQPLQSGLKSLGYQLSTVHFSNSKTNKSVTEKTRLSVNQPYTGVDIRI